ncbi:MAG: histidine phosphatase family protein [Oscillospiraceae bacterium]
MSTTPTTIHLIRHAEALGNVLHILQGRTDCPLSENGYAQLEKLKTRFKAGELTAIYTSPLIRAAETAKAVNAHQHLPLITEPDLIEIDGGLFDGLPIKQLAAEYPAEIAVWDEAHHLFQAPGGESMRDVFDRMKHTMLKIAAENEGGTVAVVSHGCAIRNFLCFAYGLPFEEISTLGWVSNTSVTTVVFDGLNPTVTVFNDISHLGEVTVLH